MTLLEEIKNGESVSLEFKEARPRDSLKFTKTVVAFANGRGGRLIFGIEDGTRNIVGIPKDKVFSEWTQSSMSFPKLARRPFRQMSRGGAVAFRAISRNAPSLACLSQRSRSWTADSSA